jgi:hypothetical protein
MRGIAGVLFSGLSSPLGAGFIAEVVLFVSFSG